MIIVCIVSLDNALKVHYWPRADIEFRLPLA